MRHYIAFLSCLGLFLGWACTADTSPVAAKKIVKTKVRPVSRTINDDGSVFFDFGKDAFAQLEITVSSPADDSITVHLGEMSSGGKVCREPGGSVRYARYTVPVTKGRHKYMLELRPDKRNTASEAVLMPGYIGEVYPFRYCEVQGLKCRQSKCMAVQYAAHYPFNEKASSFVCSDTVLNQVWDLCKYSMKATSFLGCYVDGDRERIAYEADALINQLSHYAVDCEYGAARATLERLVAHPTWPTEWHLQMPLIAWYDYLYSGDESFIAQNYDLLAAKTLSALRCDNGLVSTRMGKVTEQFLGTVKFTGEPSSFRDIVDWPQSGACGVEKEAAGETDGFIFSEFNSVVNAFHYESLVCMEKIARALGREEDAQKWHADAASVAEAFNECFLDPGSGRYRDGVGIDHFALHQNMLALDFGLVPEQYRGSVAEWVKSRGMACSVYGSQFLLEGLYASDEADYALSLMASTALRSWYNMIRLGSTITLEAWDPLFKPNLDWNHAWGAAPANIIQRKLVGVEPLEPGFARVGIRPQPGDLEWFEAKVPTPKGPIHVKYDRTRTPAYKVKHPRGMEVVFSDPAEVTDVRKAGAAGDGIHDDSPIINSCLANGGEVHIPAGNYALGSTLMIGSRTHLVCDAGAHLKIMAGAQNGPEDFLLSCVPGSEDITIEGGIWDGNCGGNDRGTDLFDTGATTGALFNFYKVKGLTLRGMHVRNPLCYYFRFCRASQVEIGDITFDSDVIIPNQDGLHFVGYCEDFNIHDLYGTAGSPNDDFLAFNADDQMHRQENFGLETGPIRGFEIRNVHSDECYCFMRIFSYESEISDIHIDSVSGRCQKSVLNMDAARYCRTPVFKDEDYPKGVGNVSDILIENVNVSKKYHKSPALLMETNVRNFEIRNLKMVNDTADYLLFRKIDNIALKIEGLTGVSETSDPDILSGSFEKTFSYPDSVQFRSTGFKSLRMTEVGTACFYSTAYPRRY